MGSRKRKYRTRHERPAIARPLAVERRRHVEIVMFVGEARAATSNQMTRFLQLGPTSVKNYLAELNRHHYLYPIVMPTAEDGRNPAVYILDSNGVKLLKRLGYEAVYAPKKTTSVFKLPHYVGLTEIYLRIRQGIEGVGGQIAASYPEHRHQKDYDFVPISGYKKPVSLKPDWALLLRLPNGKVTFLFVEFDRSTENLETLELKAKCYLSALQHKFFKKRYGYNGFRVLFVIESPGVQTKLRPQNLLTKLAALPGRGRRFWVTTYEALQESENPLTVPIWSIAGDESGATILTEKDYPQEP